MFNLFLSKFSVNTAHVYCACVQDPRPAQKAEKENKDVEAANQAHKANALSVWDRLKGERGHGATKLLTAQPETDPRLGVGQGKWASVLG